MAVPASGSFETEYQFNNSVATTTTELDIFSYEFNNKFYVEPDKHEEHCKENKLRISVNRKAMFSKKGKMK